MSHPWAKFVEVAAEARAKEVAAEAAKKDAAAKEAEAKVSPPPTSGAKKTKQRSASVGGSHPWAIHVEAAVKHVETVKMQQEPMPTTELTKEVPAGATRLPVSVDSSKSGGFALGDPIYIESSAGSEANAIKGFGSILLLYPLKLTHPPGTAISKLRSEDPLVQTLPADFKAQAVQAAAALKVQAEEAAAAASLKARAEEAAAEKAAAEKKLAEERAAAEEKAAAERAAADKAAAEAKAAEEKVAASNIREKAAAEKIAAEKAAVEKVAAEKAAAEKAAAEKAAAEKVAAEKAAAEKVAAEKAAVEKVASEKAAREKAAVEERAAEDKVSIAGPAEEKGPGEETTDGSHKDPFLLKDVIYSLGGGSAENPIDRVQRILSGEKERPPPKYESNEKERQQVERTIPRETQGDGQRNRADDVQVPEPQTIRALPATDSASANPPAGFTHIVPPTTQNMENASFRREGPAEGNIIVKTRALTGDTKQQGPVDGPMESKKEGVQAKGTSGATELAKDQAAGLPLQRRVQYTSASSVPAPGKAASRRYQTLEQARNSFLRQGCSSLQVGVAGDSMVKQRTCAVADCVNAVKTCFIPPAAAPLPSSPPSPSSPSLQEQPSIANQASFKFQRQVSPVVACLGPMTRSVSPWSSGAAFQQAQFVPLASVLSSPSSQIPSTQTGGYFRFSPPPVTRSAVPSKSFRRGPSRYPVGKARVS